MQMLVTFVLVCIGVKYANQMQSSISVSYEIGDFGNFRMRTKCESRDKHYFSLQGSRNQGDLPPLPRSRVSI